MSTKAPFPPTYRRVKFADPKDLPVLCGQCGKPQSPRNVIKFRHRRMCRECALDLQQQETDRLDTAQVLETVETFIMQRLDLDRYQAIGEREPPDPTLVLDAFYKHYGGPHAFGMKWAQVVDKMVNRVLSEGVGAKDAARVMLDVYRATMATNNAFQERDIERMSLEELHEARRRLILSEIAGMAKDASKGRLLDVIRAISDDGDGDQSDLRQFLADLQGVINEHQTPPPLMLEGEVQQPEPEPEEDSDAQ